MNGGSFYTVPSRFVSSKSATIPNLAKSLLCKVRSLTRVLFDTKAYNFAWEGNLKKIDREELTFVDVQTFFFLAAIFLGAAFLFWVDKLDDFLVKNGGGGRDLEEDVDPLFSNSFP